MPKLIGGRPFELTGPPLGGRPLAPDALMTTEGFRPWSLCVVPLGNGLAAWGPPCAIEVAPFTGDSVLGFAFCDGAEAPAGVMVDGEAVLVADA